MLYYLSSWMTHDSVANDHPEAPLLGNSHRSSWLIHVGGSTHYSCRPVHSTQIIPIMTCGCRFSHAAYSEAKRAPRATRVPRSATSIVVRKFYLLYETTASRANPHKRQYLALIFIRPSNGSSGVLQGNRPPIHADKLTCGCAPQCLSGKGRQATTNGKRQPGLGGRDDPRRLLRFDTKGIRTGRRRRSEPTGRRNGAGGCLAEFIAPQQSHRAGSLPPPPTRKYLGGWGGS